MSDHVESSDHPNNWGRWGTDDEVGALNLIGPDEVIAAVALVQRGTVFTLGHRFGEGRDDVVGPDRSGNHRYQLVDQSTFEAGVAVPYPDDRRWADEVVHMYTHGTTHVDGLGHFWQHDTLYNGKPADLTISSMRFAGVLPIAERGIVGRGVLLDIARSRGVTHLAPGDTVTVQDLNRAALQQGIEIRPGDILLLRTGWLGAVRAGVIDQTAQFRQPGLAPGGATIDWFVTHDIAVLGSDTLTNERWVSTEDETLLGLHVSVMSRLGVVFTELLDLDELALDCANDGRYVFCFAAAPLKLVGGSGAPVNPIALK